jgi:hypothetical protein
MTPRSAFLNGLLDGLSGPAALYSPTPSYEAFVPKTTLAQTFAQVGSFIATANTNWELYGRRIARPSEDRTGPA